MQNKLTKPVRLCPEICGGISNLAQTASAVYGNGKHTQYSACDGAYATTASFSALLQRAAFADSDTARAAAVLLEVQVPSKGVKTAVILLDALLARGGELGCSEEEWEQVLSLLEHGTALLPRIAADNHGKVPGGGLVFLTLCRPLQKYGRENEYGRATGLLCYALEQPLLRLAETAGMNGYEVFERVKALAPNQFFSLHQVGIEDSIPVTSPHMDYIRMGLDLTDGKIKDLCAAGQMLDADEVGEVLRFTCQSLRTILQIATVV